MPDILLTTDAMQEDTGAGTGQIVSVTSCSKGVPVHSKPMNPAASSFVPCSVSSNAIEIDHLSTIMLPQQCTQQQDAAILKKEQRFARILTHIFEGMVVEAAPPLDDGHDRGDGFPLDHEQKAGSSSGDRRKYEEGGRVRVDDRGCHEDRPQHDYRSGNDYRPRDDNRSRSEYRPRDDSRSGNNYRPRDDNRSRNEYRPRDDYRSGNNYRPRDDNRSRNEYRPRDDYRSGSDYRPRDDNRSRDEYRPRDDYRSSNDDRPRDDNRSRSEYRPRDDYRSGNDYRHQDDNRSGNDYYYGRR